MLFLTVISWTFLWGQSLHCFSSYIDSIFIAWVINWCLHTLLLFVHSYDDILMMTYWIRLEIEKSWVVKFKWMKYFWSTKLKYFHNTFYSCLLNIKYNWIFLGIIACNHNFVWNTCYSKSTIFHVLVVVNCFHVTINCLSLWIQPINENKQDFQYYFNMS